jgi:HK97 family phage major capsid protein
MAIKDLLEKRAALVEQAGKLLDKAESEKRSLTAEEQTQYNTIMADQAKMKESADNEEKRAEVAKLQEELRSVPASQRVVTGAVSSEKETADAEYRSAFRGFLVDGRDPKGVLQTRALQSQTFSGGGAVVAPKEWVKQVLEVARKISVMRSLATIYPLGKAVSLGVPTLATDLNEADWTTEILAADPTEDTALKFGGRELMPHPFIKLITASNTFLRNAETISPEDYLAERVGYAVARTEENAFMNGNGIDKPLGLFTASDSGIPTGRDKEVDMVGTSADFDGFIDAQTFLHPEYQEKAAWLFHYEQIAALRKIKDTTGRYQWQPSVQVGSPDTLFNKPIKYSSLVPNTCTSGLYIGMYGDFSKYWIADAMSLGISRLDQLFALRRKTGFLAEKETDGMPVMGEAFVRLKVSAAT